MIIDVDYFSLSFKDFYSIIVFKRRIASNFFEPKNIFCIKKLSLFPSIQVTISLLVFILHCKYFIYLERYYIITLGKQYHKII